MKDQADRLRTMVQQLKTDPPDESDKLELQEGTQLEIVVTKGVHRGTYTSEILQLGATTLVIAMPRVSGRLVFLAAGSSVILQVAGVQAEVDILERRFSPQATLVCSRPGMISRAGTTTSHTRVISITSGKGGVGKTNFTVNLALAAQQSGLKAVVFDADLGLANIDIVLGLLPKYNLTHVLRGEKTIREIVAYGHNNLPVIAGGSGVTELVNLADWQISRFINGLNELEDMADLILIDTGAGLSNNVMSFVYAATEVIVVTTPEPTAITDAYAVIKLLSRRRDCRVLLMVNRAQNQREAETTYQKMARAADKFLSFPLVFLGWLPDDPAVAQSVKQQRPFLLEAPHSAVSASLRQLASNLFEQGLPAVPDSGLRGFFSRLTRLFNS